MRAVVAALALVVLAVAACGGEPPGSASKTLTERGRAVYNSRCYFCHGYAGDANTLAATYLSPPPRDFTAPGTALTRERVLAVLRGGRPGTAMKPFAGILSEEEMAAVAAFVIDEFVRHRRPNTRYHIPENGWPDHERFSAAFPFATGELALDTPWEQLTDVQAEGKRLFLAACVSCHDRARVADEGPPWDARPLSYPRNGYVPGGGPVDAMSSATPFAMHDVAPRLAGLTALESKGEALYQANCAFCHAADGTGRNWIGQFLEPHPRDLTNPQAMAGMTRERLAATIREGLPGTSMPAWKHVLSDEDVNAIVAYVNRAFHPLPDGGH